MEAKVRKGLDHETIVIDGERVINPYIDSSGNLTLRDFFAGHIAGAALEPGRDPEVVANIAYKVANELLKRRD